MKIGNLYNLDSYKACVASAKTSGFADALAGTVLARTLTQVDPKIFEKKFPELTFVNSGIEVDNTGGYAQKIQSLRKVAQGGFTTSGDAANNKGKIGLSAEDSFLDVIGREAFSEWTETDVEQAKMQGINLISEYVKTHNEIYLREIDLSGFVGIGTRTGLLNYSGFVSSGAGGTIESLTGKQQYDAISGLIQDQFNGCRRVAEYKAGKVVMPSRVLDFISQEVYDSNGTNHASVLMALQANYPGISFEATNRADTIAEGGDLATSATVAYSTNRESMVMRIPKPLQIGEIFRLGSFHFKVDSMYRQAGLDVLENTSAVILTGL